MKRTELRRVIPLKASASLTRLTPLRRVSAKRRAENRDRRAVVAVLFPQRPVCIVPACPRWADDIHEPLTRARGGSITDPSNMAALCRPHHAEVTDHQPAWAYELGLLRHAWDGGDAA